ncbi:MAG: M1 family metallopeptidase [Chloroflexota bacterium]
MKEDLIKAHTQLRREKRANGLFFGLFAGLGLALIIWGMDSYLLLQASADYPWLKLAIGAPICIALCGLAGWLTTRLDSGLFAFIIWALIGMIFVWLGSHVPFEGLSLAFRLLEPEWGGIDLYPFVQSAQIRMIYVSVAVVALTAIAGAFELFIVEAATRTSYPVVRWFILVASMLLFVPASFLADNLLNSPLREPVLAVNRLIQDGRYAQANPVSKEKSREMGLRALRPFGDLINQPYQLRLGSYDPETLSETTVHVNFNGIWGSCYVITNTPTFCQLSSDLYLKRFACLMQVNNEKECWIKTTPQGRQELDTVISQLGDKQVAQIYNQRGKAVVMLMTTDEANQQQFRCDLQLVGDIYINACVPWQGEPVVVLSPEQGALTLPMEGGFRAGSTTSGTSTSSRNPLLPAAQENLPALLGAPRYALQLDIDYSGHSFSGRSQVVYSNAEDVPIERVYFHLLPNGKGSFGDGSLFVTQVLVDGQPTETVLSNKNTILEVPLQTKLEPGREVQIVMEFNGAVPVDFGGQAEPSGYGIYNLSQDVLALSGWYPILAVYDQNGWNLDLPSELGDSVYSDIAFYSVDVNVPIDLKVAATGVQVERQVSGQRVRLHFDSGPARDFFLVASPNFSYATREVDGTSVHAYYLPSYASAAGVAIAATAESLRIFNQKFGPYPYSELDVVQAPMQDVLGVEFPGVFLIASDLYNDPQDPTFATTVAHETAHQWWYNVVGNDVFDEPWLDESLATYLSSLYWEFRVGGGLPGPLFDYWQTRYDQLTQEDGDQPVAESLAYFEALNDPRVYGGIVYIKGALFLKALRQEIGDQAFFSALQSYYQAYQYQIGTTEALLNAFEKAAGRQLDDFYQQWLYSKNAP